MKSVEIVEVGPRDGLQNEAVTLSTPDRARFVNHLAAAGLKRIEVGAFVSPSWVPQMTGSADLIAMLYANRRRPGVRYAALTPNVVGATAALATPIDELAIFGAATETFSRRNINCSVAESLTRFASVMTLARSHRRPVRGYLSVAFGCPYEGDVAESKVLKLIQTYLDLGVYEISIGDTIGVATPKQVRSLLKKITARVPARRLAMHFHDTRGTALANVLASLDFGIRIYDSSFGGLGGCPYAVGASGNLATDDLVYMLHGMGIRTGVDLEKLLEFGETMRGLIGKPLPSRTAAAGMPKRHRPGLGRRGA